ncbi:MAG: hypothetical protein HKO86_03820, partial [Gammaproteobacteria bacterium]|nr:hypothetical protein [Gammaproteobacteria bacterium]
MNATYLVPGVCTFRQVILYLLAVSVLIMSACSNSIVPGTDESIDSAPPGHELSGDLLYDLLVGEFAGNSGDMALSVESYNRAAMKTTDARIAARASYIAVYGERYEDALDLLERWQKLDPADTDLQRMYAIT